VVLVAATAAPAAAATTSYLPWHCSFEVPAVFGTFTATSFSFTLAGVDRTNNPNWFYNSTYGSPVQRDFKAATHTGGASVLNVWTTNGPGFASIPSAYKHASYQDGIVLDYNSFPARADGGRPVGN
jgi:hypothetical protein